ncbi:hypothetical protein I601_0074 [Nocardioides dokdonensis FR1436]|uniref:Trypsin n=1 Tax=Nocardioides dokdonensis FR1436 TaxID=1300347 RepID=A0A1A9GE53_9ACTN|nr:hypothetical protein [Nocardioides dokdonensis]ANH36528.1 hypothetical protein I601_0074 [Nocardioides dokdonensis FR1436]
MRTRSWTARARTAPAPAPVLLLVVTALALVAALVGPLGAEAQAAPAGRHDRWAPVAAATITPGVQMYTDGAQCTANFVFTDKRGRVYVGYAAHCAGLGEATDTSGCTTDTLPRGTTVKFARGGNLASNGTIVGRGRLAYSSWDTMARLGTTDADTCDYNDFALVKVQRRHVDRVNPTVPFFGGPTGLSRTGAPAGSPVYSYGQSSLRPTALLSPKYGFSLGGSGDWSWDVYTLTPGIPGDSGSGFLDADGAAFGTLSTVALAPLPLSNGVGDLASELDFARRHSGIPGLRLASGTEPFSALPLG